MMAIVNSSRARPAKGRGPILRAAAGLAAVWGLLALAGEPPPPQPDWRTQAYAAALSTWQSNTQDVTAAWQLARATFDLAEVASSDRIREETARQGVETCRRALAEHPRSAPLHYYLGMNLGQIARVKLFSALHLIGDMEDAFTAAQGLDPDFDHAGPDRNLGLLYLQAPGWPLSLGSKAKARKHLEAAATRAPTYPENRLNLAEARLRWKQPELARIEARALRDLLPQARDQFTGPSYTDTWRDWDLRWTNLLEKVAPLDKEPSPTPAPNP